MFNEAAPSLKSLFTVAVFAYLPTKNTFGNFFLISSIELLFYAHCFSRLTEGINNARPFTSKAEGGPSFFLSSSSCWGNSKGQLTLVGINWRQSLKEEALGSLLIRVPVRKWTWLCFGYVTEFLCWFGKRHSDFIKVSKYNQGWL